MKKILFYSLNWSVSTNTGAIMLLIAGEEQLRRIDFEDAAAFSVVASILRGDPDHSVSFDPDSGTFASGKDAI